MDEKGLLDYAATVLRTLGGDGTVTLAELPDHGQRPWQRSMQGKEFLHHHYNHIAHIWVLYT